MYFSASDNFFSDRGLIVFDFVFDFTRDCFTFISLTVVDVGLAAGVNLPRTIAVTDEIEKSVVS